MLSINSLHDEILERQNKRNRIYEDVLEKIIAKIKYVNSKSNDCFLVYTLKNFIYGIPLYNIFECGNYIQNRLSNAGFIANYNQKNNIFISWKNRPIKEKILITHEHTKPKITSIQYPNMLNNQLTYIPNEPNMLKLKKQPINPSTNKQLVFNEVDKMFLNMNDNMNDNINSNLNYNTSLILPEMAPAQSSTSFYQGLNPLKYKNYNNQNQILNNNIKNSVNNNIQNSDNNNIKSISYNPKLNNSRTSIRFKNNNNSNSKPVSNLDEFLGTLL
jgi:hypothetical protein